MLSAAVMIKLLLNQLIYQSVNQSINQSINQKKSPAVMISDLRIKF